MEKEAQLTPITEKDWDNMKTLEHAAEALEDIANGLVELPRSDHLMIVNNDTGEALEVHPTEALIFEGMFNGAATELIQEGLGDVVCGIAKRHHIAIEETNGER